MSIKSVGEIWESRKGTIDELSVRRYTRIFRVLTDDPLDGSKEIVTAVDPDDGTSIPAMGSTWTDGTLQDQGARVFNIDPQQDSEDPVHWKVTVEYTSGPPSGTNRDPSLFVAQSGQPLAFPPEVRFDFDTYRRGVINDIYGNPVLNAAGTPFSPGIEVDQHRLVIFIEWNSINYNALQAAYYIDSINNDTYLGLPPYSLKIRKWGGELRYQDGQPFWRRQVELEVRIDQLSISSDAPATAVPDSFLFNILNAGHQIYNSGTQQLEDARNPTNGQIYSSAVPLSVDGGSVLTAREVPNYLQFHIYNEIAFGSLDIPDIEPLVNNGDLSFNPF